MSNSEPYSSDADTLKEDEDVVDSKGDDDASNAESKEIIRYSLSTLLSMRSSKLSQAKPSCLKLDLSCMAHHKPPPKMLIANMMPKFLQNQMQGRGEESISPLSFHSNSSSSSNLSYQKRYQDREQRGDRDRDRDRDRERDDGGYSGNRYYYNKYKNWDDNGGSSRIIYKTTSANASNGNNIRFLKKAYNNKYEDEESSVGLISNRNILDNASRVITGADLRSRRINAEKEKASSKDENEDGLKSDEKNNNEDNEKARKEKNLNDVKRKNDLKNNLPDDITNQMDDMFSDLNLNQFLPENLTEERESSRFSKWFTVNKDEEKKDSPPDSQNNNEDGQHQSTFPPSHGIESDKYFQPIDKVESNPLFQMLKGPASERKEDDNPLMQMIQGQPQKSSNAGQVHSVEELEAKIRQARGVDDAKNIDNGQKVLQNFFQQQQIMPNIAPQPQMPPQQQQINNPQNQEDMIAFKKLLSQMTGDENKIQNMMPPNGQQNILPMMNKNFQQPQPTPEMMMQFQKIPGGAAKMMNNQPNPTIPPHMIPSQQYGNNIDMMKFLQPQQQKMQIPQIPELVKRPEVQALVQELTSGEVSQFTLWQRLASQHQVLSQLEREIITTALNIFNANSNASGGNNAAAMFGKPGNLFPQMKGPPIPIPQGSPLSPVPPTAIDQHLLFQHQQAAAAAKLRLSPLPAAGFSMGPAVLPTNNLTLHVPGGMPQRIPSPRELQFHTQSIMQNALIRKKLEEQRENYRKRQEQEQKEILQKQESEKKNRQENPQSESQAVTPEEKPNNDSPAKKASSGVPPATQQQVQRAHAPSPNIFTPTSVLRKMTAEKDPETGKVIEKKKAIVGANPPGQPIRGQQQQLPTHQQMTAQQQQQLQFMGNVSQYDRMMQNEAFGKMNWEAQSPIKPPGVFSSGRPIVKSAQPTQNPMQQQNQPQPNMISMGNFEFQQQQQQLKLNMQMMQNQLKKQQMENPVLSQYLAQQQQRAQQQMIRSQHFPQQQMGGFQQQQQMMQPGRPKDQDEIENRGMLNNGGLSPTSNQLAKWFSPELLADASAGKLPSTKMNGGGQMMSLEEFEKCIQNN